MFYTYILQSKHDDNLYVGSTDNLERHLREHNAGDVQSTKSRRPFIIIYYEAYRAEEDAREQERQLKLRGQARVHLKKRIKNSLLQDHA